MNEKLEKQLAILIEKSIKLAEKTGEFVIDEAPDLVQQFILWETTSAIFWMCLGIPFLFMSYWIPVKMFALKKGTPPDPDTYSRSKSPGWFFNRYLIEDNDHDCIFASWVVFILAMVIALLFIIPNLLDLLKITIAPKIYLIEYFLK